MGRKFLLVFGAAILCAVALGRTTSDSKVEKVVGATAVSRSTSSSATAIKTNAFPERISFEVQQLGESISKMDVANARRFSDADKAISYILSSIKSMRQDRLLGAQAIEQMRLNSVDKFTFLMAIATMSVVLLLVMVGLILYEPKISYNDGTGNKSKITLAEYIIKLDETLRAVSQDIGQNAGGTSIAKELGGLKAQLKNSLDDFNVDTIKSQIVDAIKTEIKGALGEPYFESLKMVVERLTSSESGQPSIFDKSLAAIKEATDKLNEAKNGLNCDKNELANGLQRATDTVNAANRLVLSLQPNIAILPEIKKTIDEDLQEAKRTSEHNSQLLEEEEKKAKGLAEEKKLFCDVINDFIEHVANEVLFCAKTELETEKKDLETVKARLKAKMEAITEVEKKVARWDDWKSSLLPDWLSSVTELKDFVNRLLDDFVSDNPTKECMALRGLLLSLDAKSLSGAQEEKESRIRTVAGLLGKPCLEYCRSINDYDEKKAVHDARALTKAFNDWIGYEMIKVPEVGDIYDREIMNGMDVKYVAKVVSWVICFRNGRACEKASVE